MVPDSLATLTDKEKETLRLIVRGHDAKSMARELDLSVHTINERLRMARRKLGVTSSREAARLLFESEGGTYESLVDEDLGDEAKAGHDQSAGEAPGKPAGRILAGVLIMMTFFAIGLVLSSQFADPGQADVPATQSANDTAAADAARDWLEQIDAGDWQSSFAAAGAAFRDVNTVAGWANASLQVRGPLGPAASRKLVSVRFLNAPPHGYREVVFETRFANRERVLETVTLEQEDGVWKPVGILLD